MCLHRNSNKPHLWRLYQCPLISD